MRQSGAEAAAAAADVEATAAARAARAPVRGQRVRPAALVALRVAGATNAVVDRCCARRRETNALLAAMGKGPMGVTELQGKRQQQRPSRWTTQHSNGQQQAYRRDHLQKDASHPHANLAGAAGRGRGRCTGAQARRPIGWMREID